LYNRILAEGAFVKHVFLMILAAACLMAADATGHWAGTMTTNSGDQPAHLVLKQEGAKLTGTAGPSMDHQLPIQNGKAVNGVLTFEVQGSNGLMKFNVKHTGDEIKGDITRGNGGDKDSAKLSVKRAK